MSDRRLMIVVTYKSAPNFDAMASAIFGWLSSDGRAHCVVVENSGDHELLEHFRQGSGTTFGDRLALEMSDENVGFAPAVNRAYALACETWGIPKSIMLLNPDVITTATVVDETFSAADGAGIVAPMLTNPDGRVDAGSFRRSWNLRRLFALGSGLPWLSAVLGAQPSTFSARDRGKDASVCVDMTSGAMLVIDQKVFGSGLDTRLPMYFEDQEICLRAGRMGLPVVVRTDISAVHLGGGSRKALKGEHRGLRMMELAEAPTLAYLYAGGRSEVAARATLFGGSLLRIVLSVAAAPLKLTQGHAGREWLRRQMLLGAWTIGWSIHRPRRFSLPFPHE